MQKEDISKGEIVIYTSADGKVNLNAKLENETINVGELEKSATCKDFLQVRQEGTRTVSRKQAHYNLDMITSNALDHWRQPVESEFQADFQSDWQAQLGGNGDTSGVSRMVLHIICWVSH